METLFFLKARCGQTGQDFYIRHDLAADDRWVMTYGVRSIPSGSTVSGAGLQVDYRNVRMGPQYRCPHCGNRCFVYCGACGGYTCQPEGDSKEFKCSHCGNEGEINGYIQSVETKNTGTGQ